MPAAAILSGFIRQNSRGGNRSGGRRTSPRTKLDKLETRTGGFKSKYLNSDVGLFKRISSCFDTSALTASWSCYHEARQDAASRTRRPTRSRGVTSTRMVGANRRPPLWPPPPAPDCWFCRPYPAGHEKVLRHCRSHPVGEVALDLEHSFQLGRLLLPPVVAAAFDQLAPARGPSAPTRRASCSR